MGLALVSAVLHVAWNLLAKSNPDKEAFAWLTTLGGGLFLLALFLVVRFFSSAPIAAEVWMWAAISGVFQALYVTFLFAAYARADLSVVYPVNRGLAPILVMSLAWFLLGDSVTLLQGAGVAAAAAGAVVVGLTNSEENGGAKKFSWRGLPFCVFTAAATAGYIMTDRKAMSLPYASGAPSALDYLLLSYIFLFAGLTAVMLWRRPRLRGFYAAFKADPKSVALVSIFTPLSYLCIVAALAFSNVTVISAWRNVGIVMSVLVGGKFLREAAGAKRLAGAACVFAGLMVLAFAKS